MLEVHYTSHDFPNASVPSWGYLETSWDELLWAAITIGRPNTAYAFQHGNPSYHEAVFRASLVRLALTHEPFGRSLHRTEAFRGLDPTEKGSISYFLGMTVCKIFATRLLGTPWLLHLDVFRDQLNPVVLGGRSRPDLVGQDAGGAWHAFECKGRSSVPSEEDKSRAKAQARRLVSVNSTDCSLNIGAITFFRKDKLEFYWCDPDPEEPERLEPMAVHVPEDAWGFYYGPALGLALGSAFGRSEGDRSGVAFQCRVTHRPLKQSKWHQHLFRNSGDEAGPVALPAEPGIEAPEPQPGERVQELERQPGEPGEPGASRHEKQVGGAGPQHGYCYGSALLGSTVRCAVSVSPSKPVNVERALHNPVRLRRLPGTIGYLVAIVIPDIAAPPSGRIVEGDDRELLFNQYAEQEEGRHGHGQREPRPRPAAAAMARRAAQISRVVHDCLLKAVRHRLGFLLPRTGSR